MILGSANFSMEDFGADNPGLGAYGADNPGLGAYGASNMNTPGCDIELVCAPNDIRKRFIKNCKTMKIKKFKFKNEFLTLLWMYNYIVAVFQS